MTIFDPVILFGIFIALVLNFFNGLTDSAQGVATVVATRALSPAKAVFLTGVCNMFGPFVFTTAVAATIGTAIVYPDTLTPATIIIGMLVSITLVFSATRIGIPLSSSHALIGGLIGSSVAAFGLSAVILPDASVVLHVLAWGLFGGLVGAIIIFFVTAAFHGDVRLALLVGAICGAGLAIPILIVLGVLKVTGLLVVVLFIFISPVLGAVIAFLFDVLVSHLFRTSRQDRMKRIFTPLQVLACLFQATGHGANDGMHAVGAITALLVSAGLLSTFAVPTWVILLSAIAIGLGTCFGGWKVVDKMAKGITKIRPYQGFCAGTSGSATLAFVTMHGIPVSSNHIISGAIVGVGVTRGKNAVHWDVVRQMMTAWVITIPLAAACAFIGYLLFATVHSVLL
ncbi:MAG: inorganic phosphate transporter [Methanoregula sp.]|uniref:inorganic phosphate transporter n=1 Tax=Methanoregula sp. TaxID=2052170 RepID=UPI003BAEF3A1